MQALHSKFKDVAENETTSIRVNDHAVLPADDYFFTEYYCNIPDCNCQRVLLNVRSISTRNKYAKNEAHAYTLATIGYGWKDEKFYHDFLHGNTTLMEKGNIKGPYLDPLGTQSPYSATLLDVFKNTVLTDEYEQKLIRHYNLFRSDIKTNKKKTVHEVIDRQLYKAKKKRLKNIKKQKKKQKKKQRR